MHILHFIITAFITLIPLLITIAFFTLAERKIMAAIQRRKGPNIVGPWGLLQPFADGLKLLLKEIILPRQSYQTLFIIAPILSLAISLCGWGFLSFNFDDYLFENSLNLLFILAFSSLGVFGIILAGWASNSRYAFLGAIRSTAQLISYEIALTLILMPCIIAAGSLNLFVIVYAQTEVSFIFPFLPSAILFIIAMLAETNRAPFDLPEAEAELVAGFNVEYSSIMFALFFLAEYGNMLRMGVLFVTVFWGGWIGGFTIFIIKILLICFFFVFIRTNFPRLRYDKLMSLGWKIFLPLSLSLVFFTIGMFMTFNLFLPHIQF